MEKKAYSKEYYLKNRDKMLNNSRQNYVLNKERHNATNMRRYREDFKGIILMRLRQRAKNKKLIFNLKREDIVIPKYCPLLNIKLKRNLLNPKENSVSVDRIDSSKGYFKENIWVISFKANMMKNNASKTELITFANNILKYLNKKRRN